jgi:hypothetical protein
LKSDDLNLPQGMSASTDVDLSYAEILLFIGKFMQIVSASDDAG